MSLISLIIPCYNEEQALPLFYEEATRVLSGMDVDYEMLFVNDGSSDGTLPYLKELVDFIHDHGFNPVVHICGQTNKIWKDVADLGVAGWSIDNVASIEECKAMVGDQCKIMGNVDPGSIMYGGTPLDVRIGTLQSIRAGYDNPKGFIVMSGCSLPVETPFENIDMMMDTVREVGYPVDPGKVDEMLEEAMAAKQKEEA